MHYLLYGSGFQTWEYSPVYAIRSYAYLLLHAIPGVVIATKHKVRPVVLCICTNEHVTCGSM